jgi:hypothetical protein
MASVASSTAAAPDMSYFMPVIARAGFSERPPESKVMPLPTSPRTTPDRARGGE